MAELVVGLLGPLIDVGKLLAKPIKDQISYLFCLKNNVRALENEAVNLNIEIESLENIQQRQIPHNVEKWLEDARRMKENGENIKKEREEIELESCVFAMKSRYELSKKAKNLVKEMKDHRDSKSNLNPLYQRPHPPSQLPPLSVLVEEFPSRKETEEKIMKELREKPPKFIGIYGMGGVGKTTMAKKLMQRVSEEKLFHDVLKVDVGQDANVLKIQRDIAEQLGLTLQADSSEEDIKRKLHDVLSGDKRIFILIDDVWKWLELADLGLPLENCTVLLTSRNKDVLTRMHANVFHIQMLKDNEALSLFLREARISSDDRKLFPKAKEIVGECKGMPLALAVIGSLLKGMEDYQIWDDTLLQLRSFNVESITDFNEKVYCVLKFSIDKLESGDAKELLFLCSQFPEDAEIGIEDLALYCMSLRLFRRKYNVAETRARVRTIVEMLKNRSLLLDDNDRNFAKMHDLIRDTVTTVIGERKQNSDGKSESDSINYCKWISDKFPTTSGEIHHDHLAGSSCKKVGLLGIVSVDQPRIEGLLSSSEMREISALVLRHTSSTLLPESIKLFKCLRMLHLERCMFESIYVVGQLLKLEVLKCLRCDHIKELPLEIKELKHLKLIEFWSCLRLARIVPDVISNLVDLEELAIWDSFKGWESRNVRKNNDRNASLDEIESLKKLRVLKIDVADTHVVEDNLQLPSSLENYGICIGTESPRGIVGKTNMRSG